MTATGSPNGTGNVWSINLSTGAATNLGNFGSDPNVPGNILALSGDMTFYVDENSHTQGLATVRSCNSIGGNCARGNDYLASISMSALVAAYVSGTPASSLNAGIYGGTGLSSDGPGTGYGELFGLAAVHGTVLAFNRSYVNGTAPDGGTVTVAPQTVSIATPSGVGSGVAPQTFTSGWSGAGVSTLAPVTVQPP